MVRLTRMPAQAIVDYFHGTVDFYYWLGIPCARKWPHWVKRQATGPEKANQNAFAHVNRMWGQLPEYIKEMYRQMAASTSVTGKDIYVRGYMNGKHL